MELMIMHNPLRQKHSSRVQYWVEFSLYPHCIILWHAGANMFQGNLGLFFFFFKPEYYVKASQVIKILRTFGDLFNQ
jgi:hypothetical protein